MARTDSASGRGHWGSRLGFVLAASGSAVGLGNLWKFPYMAYANGGGDSHQGGAGAFVLIYLLAVLVVGLPVMIAEILVGRSTGLNPVGAFRTLRPSTPWKIVGALGVFTGFLLLSYYNVVAGWTIEYSIKSISDEFGGWEKGVSQADIEIKLWEDFKATPASLPTLLANGFAGSVKALPEEADEAARSLHRAALLAAWAEFESGAHARYAESAEEGKRSLWALLAAAPDFADRRAALQKGLLPNKLFTDFLANPWKQVGWALLFMAFSVGVVIAGVSKGIERWTKFLMPAFILLLVGLLVRMLTLEGSGPALRFLFRPDFTHLSAGTVLNALGQAFFSLSLGMGAIITYGSYLSKKENLVSSALSVTFMDTAIALVASLIMFSAIFSYDLTMSGGGAGNLFTSIPVIFMKIPGGTYLCVAFYLLVMFAALTSTISLMETVVAYFIDERGWARRKATLVVGALVFAIGVPAALSFNVLSDLQVFGKTWFDMADYLCANWFLPVGGLLTAIFVGWVLKRREQRAELPEEQVGSLVFEGWRFLLRYVAPLAVLSVIVGILVGTVQAG